MDFVLRTALDSDPSLGLLIKHGTRQTRKYLTDLAFADDISLLSDNADNVQKMVLAVERMALRVGLKINLSKTEFLLVGCWDTPVYIRLASGLIKQVDDFKYLGS